MHNMIALHKQLAARRDGEEGFTLIELMVVVLIIAILIAIAIPTFLGARNRADDRAAQSSLRNALTAAKTIFTDQEDYTQASPAALTGVEPSLQYVDNATASTLATQVSVDNTVSAHQIVMAVLSKAGTCFYISDNTQQTGTQFGKTPNVAAGGCKAGVAPTSGWSGSW
jgi:type IV pilus assembly protein PilA